MVVYLGVIASQRGQGIGRAMIRHAAAVATQRRRAAMTLAVDVRNIYALNAYRAEGFRAVDHRTVLLMTPKTLTNRAM